VLLDEVEAIVPGLRASLTFVEAASPRTLERYTLNHGGALYGWEPSPAQAAARRLNQTTPLPGLYLAGHWTQPGGGVFGVISSGVQLATRLLTRSTEAKLWGQRAVARALAA
jgi:prolycopene isomerase